MNGKWSLLGVPHKGWTCIDVEDLGEPSEICEMCETQEIRYVHQMRHPEYPDVLGCGCICAGHMEGDYEGARQREAVLRNASARRLRWPRRAWQLSRAGNPYLVAEGYHVVVYQIPSVWGFRVTDRITSRSIASRRTLDSMYAAKLRSFDAVVWMQERRK